jgi:hypothetical protein
MQEYIWTFFSHSIFGHLLAIQYLLKFYDNSRYLYPSAPLAKSIGNDRHSENNIFYITAFQNNKSNLEPSRKTKALI